MYHDWVIEARALSSSPKAEDPSKTPWGASMYISMAVVFARNATLHYWRIFVLMLRDHLTADHLIGTASLHMLYERHLAVSRKL